MNDSKNISLKEFLDFFPLVELPIALSDEVISQISKANKILPEAAYAEYLINWEKDLNGASEIMPCCRLPEQEKFQSIIYWKAELMSYEFILVTLDKAGTFIQKKVIAGVISNGTTIKQSAAKIEDDLTIQIMVGEKKVEEYQYDPKNSHSYYVEIHPDGTMISTQDDELLWQEKNLNQEN